MVFDEESQNKTPLAPAAIRVHDRRRQTAPSPINTAVAAWISVEGSGIEVMEIEPFIAVNGIALPLMSDSDVPTFRLAIVIVSVPEKVGLTLYETFARPNVSPGLTVWKNGLPPSESETSETRVWEQNTEVERI